MTGLRRKIVVRLTEFVKRKFLYMKTENRYKMLRPPMMAAQYKSAENSI